MTLALDPPSTMWRRLWALTVEVHKHLDTWFGYLVAASIALQECWTAMDDYVPPKWRHAVMGLAILIVWLDRTRRGVQATRP